MDAVLTAAGMALSLVTLFDFSLSAYAFASKKPGVSSFLFFRYRNGELFRGSDESFGADGFAGESGSPDREECQLLQP